MWDQTKSNTHTQVAEHACTLSEIISINVHTLCPHVCVSVVTRERERAEKAIHPMITVNTLLQSTHTHTYSHARSVSVYCQSDKSQQTLSELVQQL